MSQAFLTGSRAYGSPTGESDTDLCVLVSHADYKALLVLAPESDGDPDYDQGNGASLRFGSLNLLCFTDAEIFAAWREATEELIARKPVTRDEAVALIDAKVDVVREARERAEAEALAKLAEAFDVELFLEDPLFPAADPQADEEFAPQ